MIAQILAEEILADSSQNRQSAKINSPPKFPAIRYMHALCLSLWLHVCNVHSNACTGCMVVIGPLFLIFHIILYLAVVVIEFWKLLLLITGAACMHADVGVRQCHSCSTQCTFSHAHT